jgi:hypothetical protein
MTSAWVDIPRTRYIFKSSWSAFRIDAARCEPRPILQAHELALSKVGLDASVLRPRDVSGLRYHKEKAYCDHPAEVTGVVLAGEKIVPPNRQLLKKHLARRALSAARSELEKQRVLQQLNGLIGQTLQISAANSNLTKPIT